MITNNMIEKANNIVDIIKNNGYNAKHDVVNKNGIYMINITIGDGNVLPSFPIENDMLENCSEKEIAEGIIYTYENNKNVDSNVTDFTEMFYDYEKIKEMIVPYLSKGDMPDAAHRKYLDLNIYYRVVYKDMSVLILNKHLQSWNMTEEELYIQAIKNVTDDFVVKDVCDVIPQHMHDDDFTKGMLYFISRSSNMYGNSALLFPELFNQFISEDNCPVVIIPSSIHEILVVGKSTPEVNAITEMIKSVNQTEVNPKEVMSDHAYIYINGEIKEA